MNIAREYYLKKLIPLVNQDIIKVITGVRRAGKSTLFHLFQDYLINVDLVDATQIINVNLDNLVFSEITNPEELYQYVIEMANGSKQHYIFIDEVQNIPEFEKAIESLFLIKNFDIYITGSNSKLLSSEIATKLSGRTIQIEMTPFSFNEYAKIAGDTNIEIAFNDYLEYGGFPGGYPIFLQNPSSLDDYLRGIFDTVLMRDIAERKESVDLNILRMIVDFTFNNIGTLTSPNKIADTLTGNGFKISVNSVLSYLRILEESYILYSAKRFNIRGKKLLTRLEKYYLVDTGFRRITASRRQGSDIGHALENIVYFELKRRFDNVWVGKNDEKEIDFVTESAGGKVSYFQVSYLLANDDIIKREFDAFKKITDNHPKYVLSLDKFDMSRDGIKHMNIIDWLTEDKEEK